MRRAHQIEDAPFLSRHEASRHVQVLQSAVCHRGTGLSSVCLSEPSLQTVPLQVDLSLLTGETRLSGWKFFWGGSSQPSVKECLRAAGCFLTERIPTAGGAA